VCDRSLGAIAIALVGTAAIAIRRALLIALSVANQQIAQYFLRTSVDIIGYFILIVRFWDKVWMAELTLESHDLWRDRAGFFDG
jgi:hypothetical protein